MPRRDCRAFNLVEILITLTIVALLTTVVVNAVADYKDKVRLVKVKSDLRTLAQMCKYVESMDRTLVQTISDGALEISTALNNYIIELPHEDPWGRQYYMAADGTVTVTDSGGVAYIIDRGMGRIISPGPDGVCNTTIGYGLSDTDRDIVVEFRQRQWLVFNLNGGIYIARSDGSSEPVLIFNGSNMNVSYDRQKFVCLDAANRVTWGKVDENPCPEQDVQWPTGGTGPFVADDPGIMPFFAPDGVYIIMLKLGSGGHYNIWSINTATRQAVQLTKDEPVKNDAAYFAAGTDIQPRTLFNDGKCSFFHYIDQSGANDDVFITVSSDGKVAFYNQRNPANADSSLDMVLLNGTGLRTILRSSAADARKFRPLFWLDTETIVYLDAHHEKLYRVKQDGSYNVPLYPTLQAGLPTDQGLPFAAFSPSPDRRMVVFVVKPPAEASYRGYRIVRTDGAGIVMDLGQSSLDSIVAHGCFGTMAPAMWAKRYDKFENGVFRRRIFIPSRHGTSLKNMQQMVLADDGRRIYRDSEIASIADNDNQGLVPYAWDIDRSDNLLAVISKGGGAGQLNGVYVYSISGPEGGISEIYKAVPVGNFSIFWLR